MPCYLHIRLEGSLIAFGAPIVDNFGFVQDFPGKSTIVGLLGNALGYDRSDSDKLNRLQSRICYAVRLDRFNPESRFYDFQTAKLEASDKAWTTRGTSEGRAGGAPTYLGYHLRYRYHDSDASVSVLLELKESSRTDDPSIQDLAHALMYPARPLFLGRKACLPSAYLMSGILDADHFEDALRRAPLPSDLTQRPERLVAYWPDKTERAAAARDVGKIETTDCRDWKVGTHMGTTSWIRGMVNLETLEG
jgi:CRISPR system Cascade subunit CasD